MDSSVTSGSSFHTYQTQAHFPFKASLTAAIFQLLLWLPVLNSMKNERMLISDWLSIISLKPHRGSGTYQPLGKQVLNMYTKALYFRAEEPEFAEVRALEAGWQSLCSFPGLSIECAPPPPALPHFLWVSRACTWAPASRMDSSGLLQPSLAMVLMTPACCDSTIPLCELPLSKDSLCTEHKELRALCPLTHFISIIIPHFGWYYSFHTKNS